MPQFLAPRLCGNLHVRRWLDEVANVRVHATTKAVPAKRLAERAVMLSAPELKAPAPTNVNLFTADASITGKLRQLPRSRADVDFAIVNGNYAVSSGMNLKDGLFQERSKAYLNVGVFQNKSLDTQWAQDVIAAYRSPEFKAYALKRFPGYNYPAGWVK